jgi:hypothetical protein
VSLLRPFIANDRTSVMPDPILIDGQEEFEIE